MRITLHDKYIHVTPRYHLIPTPLATESYTSLLLVKTGIFLLLFPSCSIALNQQL
jgi:hypothetical protein